MKSTKCYSPIGLDIGCGAVKAVQLAKAGNDWRLHSAAVLQRPESSDAIDAPLIQRLMDTLDRQEFVGTNVVLAMPDDQLISSVLELPPRRSGAPIDQLARIELAQSHQCDPGVIEMDYWDLPAPARASDGTHVMAAGCISTEADALLDTVERNGLAVTALDAHPCAAARACQMLCTDQSSITAILDLGWNHSRLILVHEDVVVYERAMSDPGMKRLHKTLAGRMNLDDESVAYVLSELGIAELTDTANAEDGDSDLARGAAKLIGNHMDVMVSELRASLSYAEHQYPDAAIERLGLIGGGAHIPGIDQWMSNAIEAPAQSVTPATLITCPDNLLALANDATLTLALGLALYNEA